MDFSLSVFSLFGCSITEKQCLILTSALKSNPSHLRQLNLSENQIKNTGVNHLCDVLKDSHCKLERLRSVTFTYKNQNDENHFNSLNQNTLYSISHDECVNGFTLYLCKILHLNLFVRRSLFLCLSLYSLYDCGITDVSSLTQSLTNTKALQFLKELNLRNNIIGDSKQQLIDVLRDSNCNLR